MSDKKEKDSKVKSSKAKKNVEKTQEVSVSAEKRYFPTAVRTVVCLTVPSGTLLIRNFVLQKN